MTDNDNELSLDQLEEVNGGTSYFHTGFRHGAIPQNQNILNAIGTNIGKSGNVSKQAGAVNTGAANNGTINSGTAGTENMCPVCHIELRFDPEANAYYCTGCNYKKFPEV